MKSLNIYEVGDKNRFVIFLRFNFLEYTMTFFLKDNFIDEDIDKILALATLSLYDENVEFALFVVVHKACYHLILNTPGNPNANLLAFKRQIMRLASTTHHSLPNYKKSLAFAASLIEVDITRFPIRFDLPT